MKRDHEMLRGEVVGLKKRLDEVSGRLKELEGGEGKNGEVQVLVAAKKEAVEDLLDILGEESEEKGEVEISGHDKVEKGGM